MDDLSAIKEKLSKKPTGPSDAMMKTAMHVVHEARGDEIQLAVNVGGIVLNEQFDGKSENFRKNQEGTGRTLAELSEAIAMIQTEQHWSRTRISRAIGVYLQSVEFKGFDEWPDLELSHLYEVLSLPYDDERRLLTEAQSKLLSARELRKAVEAHKRNIPHEDHPDEVKAAQRQCWNLLERFEREVGDHDEFLQDLYTAGSSQAMIDDYHTGVHAFIDRIEAMKNTLQLVGYQPPAPKESKQAKEANG